MHSIKGVLDSEKRWYALYVNSRAEKKVLEYLIKKQIKAYVPLIKTMKLWSDRKKMIELPLLNGYVFVFISALEQDATIQTKGVVGFVKDAGKPAVIREIEIERLKQLVELGYQLEVNGMKRNYNPGDKIKISSGVLKNIEGYVNETKDGKFIEVLLESIGQSIVVKLPEEILIPVK
jgi:transcription antitermination factor NusG